MKATSAPLRLELVNRRLTPKTLAIERVRHYKDYVDILACMLRALSYNVFSIQRDIITHFPGSMSHGQIRRYLPLLIEHKMVIELLNGVSYRFVKGRLKFSDPKIQEIYLRSHMPPVKHKSAKLLMITEKGFGFLAIYNSLDKMLEYQR